MSKVDLEGRESKHITAISQGHLRESNHLLIWNSAFGGRQAALYSTVKGDTLSSVVLTLKIQLINASVKSRNEIKVNSKNSPY